MFFNRQHFVLGMVVAIGMLLPMRGLASDSEIGAVDLYQDIETVEVTALAGEGEDASGSLTEITAAEFSFLRPGSLVDAFALVPAANVRVNSRGETLVSIRGAGERQQAVFLDGAPVNVPWDNRFDLRLVPALAIGNVRVFAGPTSSAFGINTAGGVVEISSEMSQRTEVLLEGGRANQWTLQAKTGFASGNTRSLLAMGHFRADGIAAPDGRTSAFSTDDSGLITNTDREQTNVFVRSVTGSDTFQFGWSVLYSNAAFGIAPEQGPRVDAADARFWRFPDTEHLLMSGNMSLTLAENLEVQAVGWHQSFDQQINSFEDATYTTIEDIQQDQNDAYGARVHIGYQGQMQQFSVTVSSLWASHKQRGFGPAGVAISLDEFTHYTASLGGDYIVQTGPSTSLSFSVGYDVLEPRKTAGRDAGTKFDGLNSSLQLNWEASEQWQFRVSAGRKVRLPTMRELFGEAIGRFVTNPELEPEVSWLFEAAAGFHVKSGSFDIIPFWVESRQTLDQTRIIVGGQSFRQRVNLDGSRTYGVEAKLRWQVNDNLSLSTNATWSKSRVKPESVAKTVHRLYLSDRPNWLAQAAANYQVGAQTTFGLSVVYRGTAKSEDDTGVFLDLSATTQINMMLSHKLKSAQNGFDMELFARLDNLTDTFVEPQLGLPAAGRSFKLGLKTVF